MDINDRIKEVRTTLNLSQTAFAQKCGLSRDVISNIELHRNTVTNLYIKLVVDSFGVSEKWLKSGNGSMFVQTQDDYIEQLVNRYNGSDVLKKVIEAFIGLNDEERKAVLKFIDNLDPEPESVLKIARSADDDKPDEIKIRKSEIRSALNERAKSDDDLK